MGQTLPNGNYTVFGPSRLIDFELDASLQPMLKSWAKFLLMKPKIIFWDGLLNDWSASLFKNGNMCH
jgi:hypothetical protein